MPQDAPKSPTSPRYPVLAGVIGLAAAAYLVPTIDRWEGNRLVPYRDIVGVWTNCRGNTVNVDPARVMSEEECDAVTERQLAAHARPVLACVPGIADRPAVLAAAASLAYNIGPGRFCGSSAARLFRQGRWADGCQAFLSWNRAGGRVVTGLARRRAAERDLCLRDAGPAGAPQTGQGERRDA